MSDYERLQTENNSDIDSNCESEISENTSLWNAFVLNQKLGRKLSHLNFRLDIIERLIERHGVVNEKKDDQEICPVSYD
ncbi:hypothetical protein TNCV_3598451 [Trichonephila clavipes]|nr:hypothetical protein TNCV_3598451 [Trichonephila clavipes]